MTIGMTSEGPPVEEFLSQATALYGDVAREVYAAIQKIKMGEWDSKNATHVVREMRTFFDIVLEERAKVARQRKKDEGAVYDYALDLDAARAEIGRRLACLRDAGTG